MEETEEKRFTVLEVEKVEAHKREMVGGIVGSACLLGISALSIVLDAGPLVTNSFLSMGLYGIYKDVWNYTMFKKLLKEGDKYEVRFEGEEKGKSL